MDEETEDVYIEKDEHSHKHSHKHKHHYNEDHEMREHVNVFAGSQGGYGCGQGGFGLGSGGVVEGLLLGSLFGGRGLAGYGGYGAASGVELVDTAVDIETLTKLGDVQGQIGISSAQIQNSLLEQTIANQQGFNSVNAGIYSLNSAIKDGAYLTASAISNDGDKTRALIQANWNAEQQAKFVDLERQLGVAQATNANSVQFAYLKNEIVNDVKCLLASACGNGNGPKS